ncbi:alpha/beta hydrolase [Nocardioides sp. GY 10113]|uniref:alpha/beta fold hydrolase n=1 Tax=Nocardioides sp. GY 10113 TaxID=2569761 RepID=UPI0010A82AF0|nr:alpha/beta hydrolase [Nocardioides sp. GY 10113]TIC84876.1 alpha/beta hydrolase [Nocardioides sp. GY 10113]
MTAIRGSFRSRTVGVLAVAAALVGAVLTTADVATSAPAPAAAPARVATPAKPTVVLVHGAFADSSGWSRVAGRLLEAGYPVLAFSNPLRNPVGDGEYLRQFLATVPGPVVLVGHSYGGAVITNGATGSPNVKALVYVAAYAPAEGESLAAANELGGGHTEVADHLDFRPYPGAPEGDGDATIRLDAFHRLFAQDVSRREARFMGVSQRPAAVSTLFAPSGPPAWAEIPSWYLVANQDRIIPPEAERAMAARAGATVTSVDSSHVPMVSHPKVVTRLVLRAAASS